MAALIVVGNPAVLAVDPHWRTLLQRAVAAAAYVGVPPPPMPQDVSLAPLPPLPNLPPPPALMGGAVALQPPAPPAHPQLPHGAAYDGSVDEWEGSEHVMVVPPLTAQLPSACVRCESNRGLLRACAPMDRGAVLLRRLAAVTAWLSGD
eukprot:4831402-Prymnesium_polylepis.2